MMMGSDDLVGGKAQDECHQDHPIQPQQLGERVQKARTVVPAGSHPPTVTLAITQMQQPRRRRYCHRPPQHKEGAVKDRPDDDLADLGPSVGRQLQGKGGGNALQDGLGQQSGDGEGHPQHPAG